MQLFGNLCVPEVYTIYLRGPVGVELPKGGASQDTMILCILVTFTHTPYLAPLNCRSVRLKEDPHPVIVTIRDTSNYIRVLLYSPYITITRWGVHLSETVRQDPCTGEGQDKERHDALSSAQPSPS